MVTKRKKLSLEEIEELKEGADSALKLNRPDLATHLYLTIINSRNISREETQDILVDAYWKLYLLYRDKDRDYAMFVLGLLVENIDVPNGSRNNMGDIDHRTRIIYGSLRILIDHFAGSDPKMELKYARYFLLKFPLQIEAYRKLVRAHLRDGNEKEARKVISSLERRVM